MVAKMAMTADLTASAVLLRTFFDRDEIQGFELADIIVAVAGECNRPQLSARAAEYAVEMKKDGIDCASGRAAKHAA